MLQLPLSRTNMNLTQFYRHFPTNIDCIKHLESIKWKEGPTCPYCESKRHTRIKGNSRFKCNNCNNSYSVTVGTIFHKTKCDMQKWFLAIYLVSNTKRGITARQLAKEIEVTKDTALYMLVRIRRAFKEYGGFLNSIIDVENGSTSVNDLKLVTI